MKRGPEKGHGYGAAAIAQAIKDVDFPISKEELIEERGDEEIEFKKGESIRLRDILKKLPSDTYHSPADLERDIHEEMGRAA